MSPQDAIDIIDNTANLCRDIGAKGRSEELKEVVKFIEHIHYDAKARHDKILKNFQAYREEQEKKIAKLEEEIQARYEEDAGAGL
jgi:uncharacterized protein YktA (UPF0223 family)